MSGLLTIIAASCLSAPMGDVALKSLGEATYKKAVFKLYDASLCASSEKDQFNMDDPFALALDYRRKFSSEQITKAGIHEMARFARKDKEAFADIEPIFLKCFPDVEKGDQIIAVGNPRPETGCAFKGRNACALEVLIYETFECEWAHCFFLGFSVAFFNSSSSLVFIRICRKS